MADEEATKDPEIETIDMNDVPDKHLGAASEVTPTDNDTAEIPAAEPAAPAEDTIEETAAPVIASKTEKLDEAKIVPAGDKPPGKFQRLWHKYLAHKKLTFPLTGLVLLLVVLVAVPFTRYAIAGTVIKKEVRVYTVDSKSGASIFNTAVTIDGKKPGCGPNRPPYPNCFTNVSVGVHTIKAEGGSDGDYKAVETKVTIDIGKAKVKNIQLPMVAIGRLISVRVNNKITGKPIANLHVKAGNTEAITSQNGDSNLIVDPSLSSVEVQISGDGYNSLTTKVKVNTTGANFNQVSLTPAGKIYFLSKLSGKIDVVKTNLDGSSRQTVLAGTGNEDDGGTILLASRDWKYLALLSKREGGTEPRLYLINTANDQISTMDQGDASFTLVGWSGHTFVYTVFRNGVQLWQPHGSALKSFNAESGQLATIDQTAGSGTGQYDYVNSNFSTVYLVGDQVVYTQNLSAYYGNNNLLNGRQVNLFSASTDGKTVKTVKSFSVPANTTFFAVNLTLAEPQAVYVQVPSSGGNATYYEYQDGQIKTATDVTEQKFDQIYPTYLQSPSGNTTLWSEERDGKNSLFTGDKDGGNAKQIAELSDYNTYGWYSDDYVLVSKNSSELYIMPASGTGAGQVLKITDYHKPAISFYGYGGGYGGAQ